METKKIETKRLLLRPFMVEDAEDMFCNYCSDPLVTKYLTWPTYASIRDAQERIAFMREQYETGAVWDWAIEFKELGQVIGSIGVVEHSEKINAVEIGYCIGSRFGIGASCRRRFRL